MKLFLFSGLGADSRVFKSLKLPGIEMVPVEWPSPQPDESLEEYATRLSHDLKPFEPVNLLGVSFGGIIAQEIARNIQTRRVFIISSVKSPGEVGLAFHITKRLGILKIISPKKMKKGMKKMGPKMFGLTNPDEIELLSQVIEDTDEQFLKWAIGQIHLWKKPVEKVQVIHIHGTKDRMFPVDRIKGFIPIIGGGHFMIVNRADEISRLILDKIK